MQKTAIEWTRTYWPDGTFTPGYSSNPIKAMHKATQKRGHACVKVSRGCANCYASSLNRWRGTGLEYTVKNLGLVDVFLDTPECYRLLNLKAGIVFIGDMTDIFADFVPDAFLDVLFMTLEANTAIRPLLLTKRPARMRAYLTQRWARTGAPSHIGIGTSTEDQATFDARIGDLLLTPGAMRYISAEPLVGGINMRFGTAAPGRTCEHCAWPLEGEAGRCVCGAWHVPDLHWVIAGGESGPSAVPSDPAWIRSLHSECKLLAIPFFFKQWGSWMPLASADEADNYPRARMREGANIRWVYQGKKKSGALLDGVEYRGMPDVLKGGDLCLSSAAITTVASD